MATARSNYIGEWPTLTLVSRMRNEDDGQTTTVKFPTLHFLRSHQEIVRNRVKNNAPQPEATFDTAIFQDLIHNCVSASTKRFKDLRRVSLRRLPPGRKSEAGNYVIIRILEPVVEVVGCLWVIEDDQGDGCFLKVFNYPPSEQFCVGTVLIIKEPYLKLSSSEIPLIRCDCPTDIMVLMRTHPQYGLAKGVEWKNLPGKQTVDEDFVLNYPLNFSPQHWNEYGDGLYKKKLLPLALESYTLGLNACPDRACSMWRIIQSKLCVVWFDLGYYEKTITTSELIPDDKTSLVYAGRANYQLREYEAAANMFQKVTSMYPKEPEYFKELSESQSRMHEERFGNWTVERLQRDSELSPFTILEHGEYVGPVEVVDIEGKGQSVVLTEDVTAETVLMVSQALTATLSLDERLLNNTSVSESRKIFDPRRTNFEFEALLIESVYKNPNTFGHTVFQLSTGVVPHRNYKQFCDPNSVDESICDVPTIRAICHCNNLAIRCPIDGNVKDVGAGLFLFPSFLNHSCQPNALCDFYNNVVVVKSKRALKAGDEVCIGYVATDYKAQIQMMSDRDFTCLCGRCEQRDLL